jgi:hypothetical protein
MDLRWPLHSSSGVGVGVDRHRRSLPGKGIHRSEERCVSCGGGPLSSDVCLVGGERDADLALRAARPLASALPWTTSALGAEIWSPGGSGDSWWSVWPGDGGAAPGGSGEGQR